MDIESRMTGLEHRVRRLEDKDAIAELVVRYGELVDAHDAVRLRTLFTDDIHLYFSNGVVEGRGIESVLRVLTQRWDMIKTSVHVSHGHVIDLDPLDGDRATGVLFSHAEVVREGTPMVAALRYDDRYRRLGQRWLFAARKLSFFYYVEAASYANDVATDTPVRADATARPSDRDQRS